MKAIEIAFLYYLLGFQEVKAIEIAFPYYLLGFREVKAIFASIENFH